MRISASCCYELIYLISRCQRTQIFILEGKHDVGARGLRGVITFRIGRVSVLVIYNEDPSSNPAKVCNFFSVKIARK